MNKDTKTISNEYHELEYAAKELNVPVWQVMKAKQEVGNVREDVYNRVNGVEWKNPDDNCLGLLASAWSSFLYIKNQHPDDNNEFRFHIHALQNLIYAHKYKTEVKGSGMCGGF